jgi:DNA-binding SARP family transcriptional activator
MSVHVERRRRAPSVARALFALAIALALWLFRPALPALPRSFSAPLTIETIEALTTWLLWLVGAVLALALLLKPGKARPRPSLPAVPRAQAGPMFSRRLRERRVEAPSLLIPSPGRAQSALATNVRAEVRENEAPVGESASAVAGLPAQPKRPGISVLGPLAITGGKRTRRGLRARALELIAYLALHARRVHRDELLEAFWPGEDPRRTRPRLRQAVRDARRLLGDAIGSENEQYWLDRTHVDVDIDELERLLAAANTCEAAHAHEVVEGALRLFRAEPLAGSDYAWSESELPRLRATFVDLLEQVGRRRLQAGEARAALELAERGLDVDKLNESLWRLAMEAESALGLREAIAERYERLQTLLDERLGLEPAQETRHLHLRLLAQN